MFEKIILEYDRQNGELKDSNGNLIYHQYSLSGFSSEQNAGVSKVDDLLKLKSAGFSHDEIKEMKEIGVI